MISIETMEILQEIEGKLEERRAQLQREMDEQLKAAKVETLRAIVEDKQAGIASLEEQLAGLNRELDEASAILADLTRPEAVQEPADPAPEEQPA